MSDSDDLFSSEDEKLNDNLFTSARKRKENLDNEKIAKESVNENVRTEELTHFDKVAIMLQTLDLFPKKIDFIPRELPHIYFTIYELLLLQNYFAQVVKKIHLVGYLRRVEESEIYMITDSFLEDLSKIAAKIPLRFHENCPLPYFEEYKCIEIFGYLSKDVREGNNFYFVVKRWSDITDQHYPKYKQLLLEVRPYVPFVLSPMEENNLQSMA